MQTTRPKLVTMPHAFYIDEWTATDRSPRSEPVRTGRIVLLYFVSRVVGRDGKHFTQPLRVLVTKRHKRHALRYRGEIVSLPDVALFDPREDLRIGQQIEFTNAAIVAVVK